MPAHVLLLEAWQPSVLLLRASLFLGCATFSTSFMISISACSSSLDWQSSHFSSVTSKWQLISSDLLLSRILKLKDLFRSSRMRKSCLSLQKSHFSYMFSKVELISIAIDCTSLAKQYYRANKDFVIIPVIPS